VRGGQDEIGRVEMAASIDDYNHTYQQAVTAYTQGEYEVAASLVDQVVQNLPDDPHSHLLRGHVYYVLQRYQIAQAEYQQVLHLTADPELIGFANDGLESINQYQHYSFDDDMPTLAPDEFMNAGQVANLRGNGELDGNGFNSESVGEYQPGLDDLEDLSLNNPFAIQTESLALDGKPDNSGAFGEDPFAVHHQPQEQNSNNHSWDEPETLELPAFWQEDISAESIAQPVGNINFAGIDANSSSSQDALEVGDNVSNYSPFAQVDLQTKNTWETPADLLTEPESLKPIKDEFEFANNGYGEHKLEIADQNLQPTRNWEDSTQNNFSASEPQAWTPENKAQTEMAATPQLNNQISSSFNSKFSQQEQQGKLGAALNQNNFDDDSFDLEAFESAFGAENFTNDEESKNMSGAESSRGNIDFLDDFDEFDDLGNIPGFELTGDGSFSDVGLLSGTLEDRNNYSGKAADVAANNGNSDREEELFTITGSQSVPVFTQPEAANAEPQVSVEQGILGFLENASLKQKPLYIAVGVGAVSAVIVALVSSVSTSFAPAKQRAALQETGWAMALAAGLASGVTAGFMGNLTLKQIRRTSQDLQAQFDAVSQGNLNVQATVYSEDEFGHLATGFNDMARVIFTTTNEAQRKAVEQEEAKENLQRQVIRLLDDVEGAARGDLTVQAEVTADVLGAVADAFNLTIQNLRDIVQQVTVAAREVTKGSTNSETFARALSSDALRQAEELAVTLNSVQVMTDSIQRVAEAAREAEAVAQDASAIALKGGEAVENTVAGILEIRETVAETTRKVKRLAESSQEISKIVALISQIASRTNLLALNASIEAARAGEAGRGFAIVADEVRQLADKSAKSLKEIEQIVMQIQSETGSVMTAMEEGTQQVIKGTKLAEEAKRSLENIIQVANRIDILVRSITSDTVEQTETSRAVAQVMQSVELTAQETSQEAQRVSGALQHLVGVSRNLISSVERFRVETIETR
jgi:twitching motility protein PilJ